MHTAAAAQSAASKHAQERKPAGGRHSLWSALFSVSRPTIRPPLRPPPLPGRPLLLLLARLLRPLARTCEFAAGSKMVRKLCAQVCLVAAHAAGAGEQAAADSTQRGCETTGDRGELGVRASLSAWVQGEASDGTNKALHAATQTHAPSQPAPSRTHKTVSMATNDMNTSTMILSRHGLRFRTTAPACESRHSKARQRVYARMQCATGARVVRCSCRNAC
jgi:hypothetical protein